MITKQALGSLLFGMADILRDKVEDYKSYILSLLFFKRLSDNYQWEIEHGKEQFINAYKSASSRLLKKEYPSIREKLWKEQFWSQSFCLLTTGGAPLEIVKEYIQTQGQR